MKQERCPHHAKSSHPDKSKEAVFAFADQSFQSGACEQMGDGFLGCLLHTSSSPQPSQALPETTLAGQK